MYIVYDFHAPTDVDVDVADAVSDGKWIAMDKVGFGHDFEAPVFSRSRSSQATSNIKVFDKRKLDTVEKSPETNVASDLVNPVPNELPGDAVWTCVSLIPSLGVQMLTLSIFVYSFRNYRPKTRTGQLVVPGTKESKMDTSLKLWSEKTLVRLLELEVKRFTQQLAEVCIGQGKGSVNKQLTECAIAAKEVAEKMIVAVTEELLGVKTTHAREMHARDA